MAEYKLTYFNSRGLAEPIRLIFALADVEFEDVRFEKEDWPNVKPTMKWGQVPVLTFGEKQLAQSAAIARFLARKYKLVGEDDVEAARADEIVDCLKDLHSEYRKVYMEQDPEKKEENKKQFVETHSAAFLTKLTSLQEENGGEWLVGKNVTWADVLVASAFEMYGIGIETDILEGYPVIKAVQAAVFGLPKIKEWMEKRPKTEN